MERQIKNNRVVVFGAGQAGIHAIASLESTTIIVLAVSDNDTNKHGQYLAGHEIIAPSKIFALKPDQVLIASMYWKEIVVQLETLGISPEHIKVHPASENSFSAYNATKPTTSISIPSWMSPDLRHEAPTKTPLVSIILPTKDRASVLPRAIDSVLAQDYPNYELLVIDDGSKDTTQQLLASYLKKDDRIRILTQPPTGVSAARNLGLAQAQGDLIAYIDSDNRWHPQYLTLMTNGFHSTSRNTGYAGINVYDYQEGHFHTIVSRFDYEQLFRSSSIDLNTFMHRRELVDYHGVFDCNMTRLVDWDIILRFTRTNPPFVIGCALADYFREAATSRITDTQPFLENRKTMVSKLAEPPKLMKRKPGPLRLAIIQHEFPALSQTFVQNEIARFIERGIHVSIFHVNESIPKAAVPEAWDTSQFETREELASLIYSRQIDLVHTHFAIPHPADFIIPLCDRFQIPFTLKPHAFDIFRKNIAPRHHIAKTASHPLCRRVFCEGSFHKDFLAMQGVPSEKLEIVRNVFDASYFLAIRNRTSETVKRIVSISRFVEKKGYHLLIPAFRELPSPHLRLELHGYGEELDSLKKLASGDSRISIVPGPKHPAQTAQILAGADLFVLPCVRDRLGDTDGLPTVLMEAIAAGVPTLTTPVASTSDLVIHEKTGLLAETGSQESLLETLQKAIELSAEERQRLAANAKDHLLNEFAPELNISRLIENWRRIVPDASFEFE